MWQHRPGAANTIVPVAARKIETTTPGTRMCSTEDAGADATRPLYSISQKTCHVHAIHTQHTWNTDSPGCLAGIALKSTTPPWRDAAYSPGNALCHTKYMHIGHTTVRNSLDCRVVATRDGKHAKEGTLKPQAVRLTTVASWRKLRRRGSESPGRSRRREGRPRARTRCSREAQRLASLREMRQ